MLGGLIQTGVTDASLAAKYVVQKNPVTGDFEVAGVPQTGIAEFTWAGKPAATDVAIGTIINIPASEFTHTSIPLWGMYLIP